MVMSLKFEPINRDIQLFVSSLSPRERSLRFAEMAAEQIADANQTNARALGGTAPPSTTYVDGQVGAPLTNVKADGGVIFTEWELVLDVLAYIATNLEKFSPVKTGRYQKSHVLLADGVPLNIDTPSLVPQAAIAEEYIFINVVPYARKIERGLSQQAPDGVYQVVASLARRKFSKVARITFSYRTILGGSGGAKSERNPAIVVRVV